MEAARFVVSEAAALLWGHRRDRHGFDAFAAYARHYLDALDRTVNGRNTREVAWRSADFTREQRTADLAEWHALLVQRLADTEADPLLDRLVDHPVLGGPELDFVRARLAHRRGDTDAAPAFMTAALDRLQGHREMLDFTTSIEAPPPPSVEVVGRPGL